MPRLRALVIGDGPERAALEQRIRSELEFVMVGEEHPGTGRIDKEARDGCRT